MENKRIFIVTSGRNDSYVINGAFSSRKNAETYIKDTTYKNDDSKGNGMRIEPFYAIDYEVNYMQNNDTLFRVEIDVLGNVIHVEHKPHLTESAKTYKSFYIYAKNVEHALKIFHNKHDNNHKSLNIK